MEDVLTAKMKTLMTTLDDVKKYSALLAALPDFAIVIALSIVGWLFCSIFSNLGTVFVSYINTFWVPFDNSMEILIVIAGIIIGVFLVHRKTKSVRVGQWQNVLNEGAPGAIKLLQEMNWEDNFKNIRYAKLGFWFYGFLKTAAYWLLAVVFYYALLSRILQNAFHINIEFPIFALFALALALALNWSDLRRRYDKVGLLDALLWDLRWFDSEFRRADFKT